MFHSAASPFNIVDATPFGRDPLCELADACKAEGIRLGFYYSQTADWHEPDAIGNNWDAPVAGADFRRYLRDKVMPQIEELMTGYGSVSAVWFDTPGPITADESRLLVDLVHRLQPHCLVNSRIGNGLGDYDTLGDQEIPPLPRPGRWETIDTHNDTWGFAAHDHNWKSARELAERLVRVVSRGGTYMLNIGPDGRGRIPAASASILTEVGHWIAAHEAAIHGAEPTPFGTLPWGECTRRGQTLFLHVFHWPVNGRLELPGLRSSVRQAHLVTGGTIGVASAVTGITLTLPAAPPDSLIPVIALELEGELDASHAFFVLRACRNSLDAGAARLDGCELRTVSWMEKFGDWKHADCLGGWRDCGGSATWEFHTTGPGTFCLDIEYTCPADDDYAEWRVHCAGTDISFPLLDTGERAARKAFGGELPRFRTYRVGTLALPGPGTYQLVLGPTGSEGRKTRITALTLTG
jgi:alpha-L-fucosidase